MMTVCNSPSIDMSDDDEGELDSGDSDGRVSDTDCEDNG
jgi:hypothetical protein